MKMKTAAAITGVSYLGLVMPRMFQRPKQGKRFITRTEACIIMQEMPRKTLWRLLKEQ